MTFMGTVVVSVHIASCIWYLTAKLDDFSPECWIIRNNLSDSSISKKYLASIYWAVATILTVGYGDVHA